MSFSWPFLLDTVFFRISLPCSGGYHLNMGGVPLHDAVGINCKKGATTENQGAGVKYMGQWAYLDDCPRHGHGAVLAASKPLQVSVCVI